MLDQLPKEVQNTLYCNFLFSQFLERFSETFKIEKDSMKEVIRFGKPKLIPEYY